MLDTEILHFLFDLQENNNRTWFQDNKARYEKCKASFEIFLNQLIGQLSVYDASLKGLQAKDVIFRIYRDVRFSKNKEPYKTHFGAFFAAGGRKSVKAGYYIHVEPGASMLAGGLYRPEASLLKRVRQEIESFETEFRGILEDKVFCDNFGKMEGEQLKTAPKGYAKDHPAIDLLRFKSFTFAQQVTEDDLERDDFVAHAASVFGKATPFIEFLNRAMEDEN